MFYWRFNRTPSTYCVMLAPRGVIMIANGVLPNFWISLLCYFLLTGDSTEPRIIVWLVCYVIMGLHFLPIFVPTGDSTNLFTWDSTNLIDWLFDRDCDWLCWLVRYLIMRLHFLPILYLLEIQQISLTGCTIVIDWGWGWLFWLVIIVLV